MDASGVALVLIGPGSVEQVYTQHAPKKKKKSQKRSANKRKIYLLRP